MHWDRLMSSEKKLPKLIRLNFHKLEDHPLVADLEKMIEKYQIGTEELYNAL
jgi:hypothetical protein